MSSVLMIVVMTMCPVVVIMRRMAVVMIASVGLVPVIMAFALRVSMGRGVLMGMGLGRGRYRLGKRVIV
ncbi:hypothetical protein ACYJW8_06045 [Frateuria aurantia]